MWTLTTMGIGLILCVIAVGWTVRRPGHERQKAQNVRASTQLSVSTVSGVPLRSFFDGLPISPKFGGREPAVDYARRVQKIKAGRGPACNSAVSPPIVSRVISGLEHFLGLATTVHAQPPPCDGCYQHQEQRCNCAPFCSGCYYTVYVDYQWYMGTYSTGQTGCTPPSCTTAEWFDCESGACP
jgi:hypothetical protein